jgi:hypothetical protein
MPRLSACYRRRANTATAISHCADWPDFYKIRNLVSVVVDLRNVATVINERSRAVRGEDNAIVHSDCDDDPFAVDVPAGGSVSLRDSRRFELSLSSMNGLQLMSVVSVCGLAAAFEERVAKLVFDSGVASEN